MPYTEDVTPAEMDGITLSENGSVTIRCKGDGGVESTSSLTNPNWQPEANATSPHTVDPSASEAYFRVFQ